MSLDHQPAALNQVVPEYPAWAEEQEVQAQVQLSVVIDEEGRVQNVEVQRSGGKDFDESALKAARATLFQPLVKDGQALPARFVITYEFTL